MSTWTPIHTIAQNTERSVSHRSSDRFWSHAYAWAIGFTCGAIAVLVMASYWLQP